MLLKGNSRLIYYKIWYFLAVVVLLGWYVIYVTVIFHGHTNLLKFNLISYPQSRFSYSRGFPISRQDNFR